MKKTLYMAMAAIAALSSCSSDEDTIVVEPGKQALTFTATMESNVTRATYDSGNRSASWEVGDQINIKGAIYEAETAGTSTTFTISELPQVVRPTFVGSDSDSFSAKEGPEKLVDSEGTSTKWCAGLSHLNIYDHNAWDILVRTEKPTKLHAIQLWNADDTSQYPDRLWETFRVSGSAFKDGGWTEIKTFSSLKLAANNAGLAGTLIVDATQEYKYYLIEVLKSVGGDIMQMSDMVFEVYSSGIDEGPYNAYFPADLYYAGSTTLPGQITETWADGKFNMPMYASSNTTDLAFKNLCSVLKITVKSDQIDAVKSIRVSSSNKAVSGAFTVDANNAAVLTDASAVANTLTVSYTDAVATKEEGKVFYVAIPAQTYRELKIELSADGTNFTKRMVTKAGTDIAVDRNKIYPITFADRVLFSIDKVFEVGEDW